MKIKVVYEDGDLLLIEKPSGVVVNRAKTVKGETVQDWVDNKFLISNSKFLNKSQIPNPKPSESEGKSQTFYNRSGIVHRLDKETSGLLLIAKNPQSFENLQRQFKERGVEKRYLALVHGEVKPPEGEIRAPVGRLPWNRERFGVFPGGREALTKYRVIQYLKKSPNLSARAEQLGCFSLLEVTPATGRTHQIRVHLKYLSHPLVGDSFYAGRKRAALDRKWCRRLFLHASFLKFKQPVSGKWLEVGSKLPESLEKILMNLHDFTRRPSIQF